MSKKQQRKQKAIHATKILFLLIMLICNSFTTRQVSQDDYSSNDYRIVNSILKASQSTLKGKPIYLSKSTNNDFTIGIIKAEMNKEVLKDSLSSDYGLNIPINGTTVKIFNKKEYSFLLSQRQDEVWNFKQIQSQVFEYDEKGGEIENCCLYKISKPVYTSNGKYALVTVQKRHGWVS